MELCTHYSSGDDEYVGEMIYTGGALSKYKKCTFTVNLKVTGQCLVNIIDDAHPSNTRVIQTNQSGSYSVDLNKCTYLYLCVTSVNYTNSISNITFS